MTREKKTIYKNLGWIALGLAILIIFFYFVCSYGEMSNEHITYDKFAGRTFITEDRSLAVQFSTNSDAATVITENAVYRLDLEYVDNIFILKGNAEYEFIVIDVRTLFSSAGDYLYRGSNQK